MKIYYPSVERGASLQRIVRHREIKEHILSKGVEVQARPSSKATRGLSWLQDVDGVIMERSNFVSQLERETWAARKFGKNVLILLDRTDTSSGRRGPSDHLRAIARPNADRKIDANSLVRIVEPTPSPLASIISRVAIDSFLQAHHGVPIYVNPSEDRLTQEPEPFLDPVEAEAFEAAFEADLRDHQIQLF